MNMASICIFWFFLVIFLCAGNASFVKVECQAENMGQFGQESLLNCVVKTTEEVNQPEFRVVLWQKVGVKGHLLFFKEGELSKKPGYRFAEPSWSRTNMNVSLLISNTAVEDEGEYTCIVVTDSGDSTDSTLPTKLNITAKYNAPVVQSITENLPRGVDRVLKCNCDGGYPKGQLRWFDEHNTDWTKSAEMKVEQAKNGLFQLSSQLTLLPGSTFSKYTCVVFNASGGKEDEATYFDKIQGAPTTTTPDPSPSKIVAPVVVIGSLVVGLLLVLLVLKRRSQKARRPSTSPLMGDHQEVCTCDLEEGDDQKTDEKCQV